MTRNLVQCTCYLIILTLCIDRGDGKWKRRDREKFHHDVLIFEKTAEKIKSELREFYKEFPLEIHKTKNDDKKYNKNGNIINGKKTLSGYGNKYFINVHNNITSNIEDINSEVAKRQTLPRVSSNNISGEGKPTKNTMWPKFEEILLAIGKRYDWKNDRWIKVKEKLKTSNQVISVLNKYIPVKHNFSYRTVKLNKSKNRRNVVIAVSAVR